jgi:hypothetical protein
MSNKREKLQIIHLFSWESEGLKQSGDEGFTGCCFWVNCPCCGFAGARIEVYADRVLGPGNIVMFENENHGIFRVADSLSRTVAHELVHWAIGPMGKDFERGVMKLEEVLGENDHGYFVNGSLARKEWRRNRDDLKRLKNI